MPDVDLDKLLPVFERYEEVVAVWAFGSAVSGRVGPDSDLDIGVQFRRPPEIDRLCDLRADVTSALQFEQVDLVPLNDASSILRFEAVSGRLLFSRDDSARAGFVSLASREYEDDMAQLARQMTQRAQAD
jgi:hypothetical protein